MRVLVFGGRAFRARHLLFATLDRVHGARWPVDMLIHGAAPGADSLAARWARLRGIRPDPYPADWARYGNAAGAIRNAQMLREGKPEAAVSFPGGRGTSDMMQRCLAAGLEVLEVDAAGQWWVRKAPQREKQGIFIF